MSEQKRCFLCGKDAEVAQTTPEGASVYEVACKRCGRYAVAAFVQLSIDYLSPEDRAWLAIHTRNHPGTRFDTLPGRRSDVCEINTALSQARGMPAVERAGKALVHIAGRAQRPSVTVLLSTDDEPALCATNGGDLQGLLAYLSEQQWLKVKSSPNGWEVSLTALGETQVAEWNKGGSGSKPPS